MIPHYGDTISILDNSGLIYYLAPNSNIYVNKYLNDNRRNKFPYSEIPTHNRIIKGKKYEYINQILEFNKVYIEISDGLIKEYYVIKDSNESLLVTKVLIPNNKDTKYLMHDDVSNLISGYNGNIFDMNGKNIGKVSKDSFVTEERIVEWYKEYL